MSIGLKTKNKHVYGFTLIELILAAVVLLVIVGLAIPNFSHTYKNLQLKQCTDDIVYMMRYAQSRAIVKNNQMRIVFNDELTKYWLEEESDEETAGEQTEFKKFEGRLGRSRSVAGIINLELEENQIFFYPDGTIDKQYIFVCSQNKADKEKCFTISTKEQRGHVHIFNIKV